MLLELKIFNKVTRGYNGTILKIYKELIKLKKKQVSNLKKWVKDSNIYFTKEDIKSGKKILTNTLPKTITKCMKKGLTLLVTTKI